jgi:hypothetical protein
VDYYADSSVLVKRHIQEVGSVRLRALVAAETGSAMITVQLSEVEVVSAVQRRAREGMLSTTDAQQLRADVQALFATDYQLITVNPALVQLACELLQRHLLRAYDALQLAAAVVANQALLVSDLPPLTFLSADQRLLQAAQAEGLTIEDFSV